MTPEEIAIFNERIRLERSIRGGVVGFNPADPILNLQNSFDAQNGVGTTEVQAQRLAEQRANLNRNFGFSPSSQGGLPDIPSTSLRDTPYGGGLNNPTAQQQLQNAGNNGRGGFNGGSSFSNIGANAATAIGGTIGTFGGGAAAAQTFGGTSGLGAGIGGSVGSVVGGGIGGALGGAVGGVGGAIGGSALGSAIGGFFGGFLGGAFESGLSALFGGKPNRNGAGANGGQLGNNWVSPPPNEGRVGSGEGQNIGVQYCIQLRVDYRNFSHPPTFHIVSTNGALNFFSLQTRAATAQVGTPYEGAITSVGISRRQSNGVFIQVNGIDRNSFINNQNFGTAVVDQVSIVHIVRKDGQFDPPPFYISPNAANYSPNSASSGGAIDVLGDGESYIVGTGMVDPSTVASPDGDNRLGGIGGIGAIAGVVAGGIGSGTGGIGGIGGSPTGGTASGGIAGATGANSNSTGTQGNQSGTQTRGGFSGTAPQGFSPNGSQVSQGNGQNDFNPNPKPQRELDFERELQREENKIKNPEVDPNRQKEVDPRPTPNPRPEPNEKPENKTPNIDIAPILGGLATAIAGITALKIGSDLLVNNSLQTTPKIDNINNNTSPANQQANAATGACTALNNASCTSGLASSISTPIVENANQNRGILENALNGLQGLLAPLAIAVGSILKLVTAIYNNQFIHSTLSVLGTFTSLHNAAILSRDLGETLGEVVDNGLNLAGLKLKDQDGNQQDFSEFIGGNVKAIIANIIGQENYASLTLKWQKASAIFNSAANVLNTTQSMIDPLASAVEYGMENVSKIGNSLKDDGVVSENAYPNMDETVRARNVNRFERLNDTLEGAEDIVSNLANVTSDAISIKEDFKQLREDKKDLIDKANEFNTTKNEEIAAIKEAIPEITDISVAPAEDDE